MYTAVGGVTHLYHDNGSLKDDGTNEYKYDAWNHLIEVKRKSDSVVIGSYKYDAVGLGRRTKKTANSLTTRFIYADQQSIEELDDSDSDLLRLFVFGQQIDQIVMMEAPDQADVDDDDNTTEIKRFFCHTQLIGTVTHVTDASQSTVESYEYDPYGKPTIKDMGGSTVSASPIGNPYLFTSRQFEEESGLYHYRARHYSPALMRFVQRDPLEYVDGPNTFAYVRSRPTPATDPSGLTSPSVDPSANGKGYQPIKVVVYSGDPENDPKGAQAAAIAAAQASGLDNALEAAKQIGEKHEVAAGNNHAMTNYNTNWDTFVCGDRWLLDAWITEVVIVIKAPRWWDDIEWWWLLWHEVGHVWRAKKTAGDASGDKGSIKNDDGSKKTKEGAEGEMAKEGKDYEGDNSTDQDNYEKETGGKNPPWVKAPPASPR